MLSRFCTQKRANIGELHLLLSFCTQKRTNKCVFIRKVKAVQSFVLKSMSGNMINIELYKDGQLQVFFYLPTAPSLKTKGGMLLYSKECPLVKKFQGAKSKK